MYSQIGSRKISNVFTFNNKAASCNRTEGMVPSSDSYDEDADSLSAEDKSERVDNSIDKKRKKRQVIYPPTTIQKMDNCPASSYCMGYNDQPTLGPSGVPKITGVCCPEPKLVCPAGTSVALINSCQNCLASPNCCPDNYFCHTTAHSSSGICCPKPCANSNEMYINGQCLSAAKIGEACVNDEQCAQAKGKCLPTQSTGNIGVVAGRCACSQGMAATNGICTRRVF